MLKPIRQIAYITGKQLKLLIICFNLCFFMLSAPIVYACHKSLKYTEIYINSTPSLATVSSAQDGQYLGETPLALKYDRRHFPYKTGLFTAIIESPGYKPILKMIHINRWGDSPIDATTHSNRINVILEPIRN